MYQQKNGKKNLEIHENQKKKIEDTLRESILKEEIPQSLMPENMQKKLEHLPVKEKQGKQRKRKTWMGILTTAACFGILVTTGTYAIRWGSGDTESQLETSVSLEESMDSAAQVKDSIELEKTMEHQETVQNNEEMYQKIYDTMEKSWSQWETPQEDTGFFDRLLNGFFAGEDSAAGNSSMEEGAAEDIVQEMEVESATGSALKESAGDFQENDYGGTNLQVEFVDEGDIIKNDGRYLYQIVNENIKDANRQKIQITDTEQGLKRVAVLEGFENITEFYVHQEKLVIIEKLWAEVIAGDEPEVLPETEEIAIEGKYGGGTSFSKVSIYDLSEKASPKELHTFTIRGDYKTSRISKGYLYFFTGYQTEPPKTKQDFKDYIPVVEGELLGAEELYLPEETDATGYLMMLSVDLSNPVKFTDKMAAVTWGNYYYVSGENIYILDHQWSGDQEGIQCDGTRIMKFSYKEGQITLVCENVIQGTVLDQFAMDEYKGYFRIITTVSPYKVEKVVDDVSGEEIGYSSESMPESNSVYVLDENLQVSGSIENLAEEERVYSARFMGNTGYFVTFKQTDPLFSVDFSNPTKPKILGELKITGFSEYLHFYGEDLLLGIGYEADEETGITQGIKISMFDISNPADVKEIHKLETEYQYSDALYNHHSVLISANKNLVGFMAERYGENLVREYATYSYDINGFSQRFTIDCSPAQENDWSYYQGRGTYIGDTFYFLLNEGSIYAYQLNTGKKIEELKP